LPALIIQQQQHTDTSTKMMSGDEDFTDATVRRWEVEHQAELQVEMRKKNKEKKKEKKKRRREKKEVPTKAKEKITGMDMKNKNDKEPKPQNKPKRRCTRGSRVGLEPGSPVIWSGRDGAIFVGTALLTAHAREAGTIWVGRGSGRYYKRELVRISRRCATPCEDGGYSYFHSATGDVFVRKPKAVVLLTRTAAAMALSLPADVLRHICSFFRCPQLLPASLAATAAQRAKQAASHAARISVVATVACVHEEAAQALIRLAACARRD
jgi:hypothetical protein